VAVTIWGGAEGSITIIAASIPVLRTLIIRKENVPPAELSPTDERRLQLPVSFDPSEKSQLSPVLPLSPLSGRLDFNSPLHSWGYDKDG
jgi:hypothetical protein